MAAATQDTKDLIAQFDALNNVRDIEGMYNLMVPHKGTRDAEVLWRVSLAITEKGKMLGGDQKKAYIYEAFEHIKLALELDDTNPDCHKWYGVYLDYVGEYEGIKQRLTNAYETKDHFLKGIELNPTDPVLMYCLGYWCFMFADMPWYQRKVASVVFKSPPTSTYEEALKYFEDAEKTKPGFYNPNLLMIATILIKIKGDKERAKEILLKAAEYDAKTADDIKAKEDATNLLKKEFGIKI